MIKAIIFDMNGVIIDDLAIHSFAFSEVLQDFHITIPLKEYLKEFAGKTDRAGFEDVGERFSIELPVDELLANKGEAYLRLFSQHKKRYPGVIELIKKLSKNYVLALASSATRAEVDLITKEFGIDSYFKVAVSAEDVSEGKPNPEPYLKTASLLKVSPDECVVIEDSIDGVVAAKSAGCFCIRVATTHPKDLITKADRTVDSFEEISGVIERIHTD